MTQGSLLTVGTDRPHLNKYAWLAIAAALATILLKTGAWWVTGSVGLLSDALESIVNLVGAMMALAMLTLAARPPDESHTYGHGKAEYFSSGLEGGLIVVAALAIGWAAIERLLQPQPLEQVGAGLAVAVVASLINLGVSLTLRKAARQHDSITLAASASHLMTDVWTSAGVVTGVALVGITGWLWLDPLLALGVAVNIIVTGYLIMRDSAHGLMDRSLPEEALQRIESVLAAYRGPEVEFHALRTRAAGARRFASMHVLVPGAWTVQQGHELLERLEADLRSALPGLSVLTHLEPLEDPAARDDHDISLY
jgi:cation diffusion facilitator family transporter